ncbi:hypothetical protein U9M48_041992 [Paspalum notatum var. saurae]|uniref:SIAH-type domain-containing protein n=1 Tax=Paspalum notatum var. saurae TaxID=547442 RepID=A0AAQ3UTU7_PASNO
MVLSDLTVAVATSAAARGPCPHAAYGCDAWPANHAREEHLRACPHGPCHCPGGDACGFVGSTAALLDHIAIAHDDWLCETLHPFLDTIVLRDGPNLVVSAGDADDDKYLFLLTVDRYSFCRAVSVVCIRPRSRAAREIKAVLEHQRSMFRRRSRDRCDRHDQRTDFTVACSDLSDHRRKRSYQLTVPDDVHGDGETYLMVGFRIVTIDATYDE